nr:hypothetical protein [Cerasicoccus arenae]
MKLLTDRITWSSKMIVSDIFRVWMVKLANPAATSPNNASEINSSTKEKPLRDFPELVVRYDSGKL